eukprot:6213247-Pleurochrysis_carterae.AAC.5
MPVSLTRQGHGRPASTLCTCCCFCWYCSRCAASAVGPPNTEGAREPGRPSGCRPLLKRNGLSPVAGLSAAGRAGADGFAPSLAPSLRALALPDSPSSGTGASPRRRNERCSASAAACSSTPRASTAFASLLSPLVAAVDGRDGVGSGAKRFRIDALSTTLSAGRADADLCKSDARRLIRSAEYFPRSGFKSSVDERMTRRRPVMPLLAALPSCETHGGERLIISYRMQPIAHTSAARL